MSQVISQVVSQPRCFEPDQARYEIEELLGEGLNSKVYRAVRKDSSGHSHQRVALKFLKDQTSVSFLRREFETLLKVRSNYCARTIAWETQNGENALAMEWIDGLSLFEFATQTSVSEAVADEIARQIYLGLIDLRSVGLYHGDLQPMNVMIDRSGVIRLIDFASGRTAEGFIQATPAFAAPEVISVGHLSFEADLFALGMIRENVMSGFRHLDSPKRHSLLHPEASRRSYRPPRENTEARAQLAHQLEQLLSVRGHLSTQIIEPAPISRPLLKRRSLRTILRMAVAVALVFASAVAVPVRAEAPAETGADPAKAGAKLIFTSNKWVSLEVNGREAGFAPLTISGLRAGSHRISWRMAKTTGVIRITLAANQTIHLSETRTGKIEVR